MIARQWLGINYAQQYQSGLAYNATNVNNDLVAIWNLGIRRIRIGAGDLNTSTFHTNRLNVMKQIALDAKAMGFYVCFTVICADANDTKWANIYIPKVREVATWAWNNNMNEYQIGNEQEAFFNIKGTLTDPQGKIRSLATDIKNNYFFSDGFTRFTSYAFPQGYSSNWLTNGMGDLDLLSVNVYNSGSGSWDTEFSQIKNAFGREKVYYSEWNVSYTWSFRQANVEPVCVDEKEECVQVAKRFRSVLSNNTSGYFFTWRWDQSNDQFALYNSLAEKQRRWKYVLFGNQFLDLSRNRRPNTINHGYAHDSTDSSRRCRRSGTLGGIMRSTDYTLSLWVYPRSFAGPASPYLYEERSSGAGGTAGTFRMQLAGSQPLITTSTSAGSKHSNLSMVDIGLRLNQWNHIIWKDKNGAVTAKINNERGLRPFNYTRSGTFNTDQLGIGIPANPADNTTNFPGMIDEVAVFPFATTNDQDRQMYEQGNSYLPNVTYSSYYRFNEGSGTTVTDSSGNGNDLTLNSATGAWVARTPEVSGSRTLTDRTVISGSRDLIWPIETRQENFKPIWEGMGMNYGQDFLNGSYNATTANNDLARMWNLGIRKLRIAMSDYTYTAGVNATKSLALAAKQRGFYVMWGVTHPGFGTLKNSQWDAYCDAVAAEAIWANDNGIDEFQVGNEIEYSETIQPAGTFTDSVTKIQGLATRCRPLFERKLSYSVGQDTKEGFVEYNPTDLTGWRTLGKGDLDYLCYNVYGSGGSFADFQVKINLMFETFGADLHITEWNLHSSFNSFPATEEVQAERIHERLLFMQELGISQTYFFAWRWDTTGSKQFALRVNNTYRLWFNSLFEPL